MLCPISAKPVEEAAKVQRNVMCRFYDECLDIAIEADWENFSCLKCSEYMQTKRMPDQWLEENTFVCSLGRLTIEQCESNRRRKRLSDRLSLQDRSAEATQARVAGIVMPTACESCADFERLHAEFHNRTSLQKRGRESMKEGVTPTETRKCKECQEDFIPYKRGAVTIKSICEQCFNKKTVPPNNKLAPAPAPKAPTNGQGDPDTVPITFSGKDRELLDRIIVIAGKDRRTVEAQVLYWLENRVPELREGGLE